MSVMGTFLEPTQVFFKCLGEKYFNVSSICFTINLPFLPSSLNITWYGVIIAFGFTLAALFGGRMAYKWKMDINKMIDVLIYGAFCGIIGARLYYCISEWDSYFSREALAADPIGFLKIWEGGLAIYGGIIGGIFGGFLTCKFEKLSFTNLLDLVGMSLLIGQGIGRWGNFANQEAFGINTDLPWGMRSSKTEYYLSRPDNIAELTKAGIQVDPTGYVHPTFLYESLWCLIGFVILYIICKKARKFSGQIFLCYGIWYGTGRAIFEGLRTDSLYIANTTLRVSQVLSIALVAVCLILLIAILIKVKKHPVMIEGIDYYTAIPVYNKKRKALEKAMDELEKQYSDDDDDDDDD